MKKLLLTGLFALLCTTLFSCTADENETPAKNNVVKKIVNPVADGPGDDPVPPPPPPPLD